MTTINCKDIYTITAAANGEYKVVFPSAGGSVCVKNDTEDDIVLRLSSGSGNEKLTVPSGEAVNELHVPTSAVYINTADAGSVCVIYR